MPTKSAKVERYFHKTAFEFNDLYNEGEGWQQRLNHLFRRGLFDRVRLTVAQFQDLRDFDVLDVGCGSGRNSLLFVQAGAHRVVGIDFAENMLELARQTAAARPQGKSCEFVSGDMMSYRFDCKFDVSVALGVFDYIDEPEAFLRRMAELSDRKIIASFPAVSMFRAPFRKFRYTIRNCPLYFYTRRRLEEISAKAGLTDFEIIPYASSGFLLVARLGR